MQSIDPEIRDFPRKTDLQVADIVDCSEVIDALIELRVAHGMFENN
jgi:hypothetical protein